MKKNFKKGFTLVELSVAMAVAAIALAMLSVCFVAMNKFFINKNIQSSNISDLQTFHSLVKKEFETYQSPQYEIADQYQQNTLIIIKNNTEEHSISFSNSTLFFDNIVEQKFIYFSNVVFSFQDSIFRCDITYGEEQNFSFSINKRI